MPVQAATAAHPRVITSVQKARASRRHVGAGGGGGGPPV